MGAGLRQGEEALRRREPGPVEGKPDSPAAAATEAPARSHARHALCRHSRLHEAAQGQPGHVGAGAGVYGPHRGAREHDARGHLGRDQRRYLEFSPEPHEGTRLPAAAVDWRTGWPEGASPGAARTNPLVFSGPKGLPCPTWRWTWCCGSSRRVSRRAGCAPRSGLGGR
jgi:hypothetical protein